MSARVTRQVLEPATSAVPNTSRASPFLEPAQFAETMAPMVAQSLIRRRRLQSCGAGAWMFLGCWPGCSERNDRKALRGDPGRRGRLRTRQASGGTAQRTDIVD
jgi:hypothetical protein